MEISFESNIREWERSLSHVQREQVPFATALALSDTARYDVKSAIEQRMEVAFDKPTPFTKRGVAYRTANKHTLVARVFIMDIQQRYLKIEEHGGIRRPEGGRALVVPVGQRVNQYGNLPRGTVQRLLARKDTFSGRINGTGGIWQRKSGNRLKLLIAWQDTARYRPVFKFYETARAAAELHFPRRFAAALNRAIASSWRST